MASARAGSPHPAAAAAAAAAGVAFLVTASSPPASHAAPPRVPQCQSAILTQQPGPSYRVLVCGALQPSPGKGWRLVVENGPLRNGAVLFGFPSP